jgi:hypothetical protein
MALHDLLKPLVHPLTGPEARERDGGLLMIVHVFVPPILARALSPRKRRVTRHRNRAMPRPDRSLSFLALMEACKLRRTTCASGRS